MKTVQYDSSYHKDEMMPTGKNFLLDFDPYNTTRPQHMKCDKPFKDCMTGSRFGRLTIIKFTRVNGNYDRFYLCKCDCGNEKEVVINSLLRGVTRSCGCLRVEKLKERFK